MLFDSFYGEVKGSNPGDVIDFFFFFFFFVVVSLFSADLRRYLGISGVDLASQLENMEIGGELSQFEFWREDLKRGPFPLVWVSQHINNETLCIVWSNTDPYNKHW